jgi:3-oxoacyl-[acyl-carrier protein] reductase
VSRGPVVVVTGAASGIGRHLAGALAAGDHRVLAADVNEAALAELARSRSAAALVPTRLDVRREADWEAALDVAERAFGPVDVLLNVAGVLRPGYVHEVSAADVDLQLDVNVKGTVLGTSAAAKRMVHRRAGHVVNFGSLASLAPTPGLSLYSASKFAVRGFSLAAATELAPHGVAVTLVMPDAVQTPMLDLQAGYEEAALTFSGDAPLTTDDIERLILDKVLPKRPLEVALPASRAALARLANAAPAVASRLAAALVKKGLANQERYRRERGR